MLNRRTISLVCLTLLLSVLGRIIYVRGFGARLGAQPARIQGPYSTERAWIVDEIVRDITEMASYPSTPSNRLGSSDLHDDLWLPDRFAVVARAALAASTVPASPGPTRLAPVHAVLTDPSPAVLVTTSGAVSRALGANMRDRFAHEAAALVLGAFAMRESDGRFNDPRWAMNRMTAHLAMASALSQDARGVDGQLADAVLLLLANRQTLALEAIDRLERGDRSQAVNAWIRSLRLRITQDTRATTNPRSATLLEQQEYVRARRATAPGMKAGVELEDLLVTPSATWFRLIEASPTGVEDGWLITDALRWERAEYEDVFQRIHGRAIDQNPARALNARATRCLAAAGPDVLPWGAWAEFEQRQLAMFIAKSDRFCRHTLDKEHKADSERKLMNRQLGSLALFPIATIFRTAGPRGGDADLEFLNDAIAATVTSPERVPAAAWTFLDFAQRYEPIRHAVPKPAAWFVAPSAGLPFDIASRSTNGGRAEDALRSIRQEAPYDYALASAYLKLKYGEKAPYAEIRAAYGPRLDYDIRALRTARAQAPDDERLALLRTSCDIDAHECVALGSELARADRASDASLSYERAFADPSVDEVAVANSSSWLVSYYYKRGRTAQALDLAERSAATFALQGLVTSAYLYERLGRLDQAEAGYKAAADRYNDPAQLLGFYYRTVALRNDTRFEKAWTTTRDRVFPRGLVTLAAANERPLQGATITKDSKQLRDSGLQAGDIVIGLEGWRVESLPQFRAINAFFENDVVKITAWRGAPFTVTVHAPGRRLDAEFRSYPIEGWSER